MRKNFFIKIVLSNLLIVFLTSAIFGQEANPEEIVSLIRAGKENYDRGTLYGIPGAITIAKEKFTKVLEFCNKEDVKECRAVSLYYLGEIFLREGENERSVDYLRQSRDIFQGLKGNLYDSYKPHLLLALGTGFTHLGKNTEALEYFNQTLKIVPDKSGEATVLVYIGDVFGNLKQKDKALENYQRSLSLFRTQIEKFPGDYRFLRWELAVLNNIAVTYYEFGEIAECLEYNRQIFNILKGRNELIPAVLTLNNMHMIAVSNGRPEAAFKSLSEAITLSALVSDKRLEADILTFAVSTNFAEGNIAEAIRISEKVLLMRQQFRDITGEASLLAMIGGNYLHIGNYSEAISYYERSLLIFKSQNCQNEPAGNSQFQPDYCRQFETTVITGLGKAYNSVGRKEEALRILESELGKIEAENEAGKILPNQYKGFILEVIGQIYFETDQSDKAIKYFSQALPLINSQNVRSKSAVLTDIGKVQANSDNKADALLSYNQALLLLTPFAKNLKKGREEATGYTLTSLMLLYKVENPKVAVLYGKKAVDAYQQNRGNIKTLDKETQKLYLKSVEFTYRTLAELLLGQKRDQEAQQIINSLKDQQFFDFDETQTNQITLISLTPREQTFVALYEKSSENVSLLENQIGEFKLKLRKRQPTSKETSELAKMESDLKTASDNFLSILKQAETAFSKPPDEQDKVGEIPDFTAMQTALREISVSTGQKAAAVYQLVGEEDFHLLIITADNIKSVSTPVERTILNEQALDFWALLQSPNYDPRPVGSELYETVFKPIETLLPEKTQTILWSLDGNLRYVPMAALYDGEKKQYLVERFNHVNFTRADMNRMTRDPSKVWTGTGFGSSQSATVRVLGDEVSFDPLPGVTAELAALFNDPNDKILEGKPILNDDFNRKNFIEALKLKLPFVHIASHFSFRAGDEARSFLLLGDRTAFTLADMKAETNLFQGVDLLTLSACNTAAAQSDANGREIDGFAELAQRLGANSVMATLWSVADSSTPRLMTDFYRNNKNMSKADALREAQIALLQGKPDAEVIERQINKSAIKIVISEIRQEKTAKILAMRSKVFSFSKRDAPEYIPDDKKPFAHPFYWSPFILFGNWK